MNDILVEIYRLIAAAFIVVIFSLLVLGLAG